MAMLFTHRGEAAPHDLEPLRAIAAAFSGAALPGNAFAAGVVARRCAAAEDLRAQKPAQEEREHALAQQRALGVLQQNKADEEAAEAALLARLQAGEIEFEADPEDDGVERDLVAEHNMRQACAVLREGSHGGIGSTVLNGLLRGLVQ